MSKPRLWIHAEASGRLIYRRRFPDKLRPFLPKPDLHELKVSLGSSEMTPAALRKYEQAIRKFDEYVETAQSALTMQARAEAGGYDTLTPERINHLAATFLHNWHVDDEASLRREGAEWSQAAYHGWEWMRSEYRRWRIDADYYEMEQQWGDQANKLLAAEGLRLSPSDTDSRQNLLWALNDVALKYSKDAVERLRGEVVVVPPKPEPLTTVAPIVPAQTVRTVSDLLEAYSAAKSDSWSKSSQKAFRPVATLLGELIGKLSAEAVDRVAAREIFELVKKLPLNVTKVAALKGLNLREAIKKAEDLGLPVISPKTVNNGYLVHIAGVFNWAVSEEWTVRNPFKGLSVHDPVDDQDKRDPFQMKDLATLFSASPWDAKQPHDHPRPARYWLPLIGLYSGMRLGEMACLRIMDIDELDGVAAFRVRPYEGRKLKNKESRRDIPIHPALLELGLMEFVEYRRTVAGPEDLLFPDGGVGANGQAGAHLSKWFSRLVKDHGFVGAKLGMHSFRHNFEDRLRAAGLHGRPEGQALAGRRMAGSEAAYGTAFSVEHLLKALKKVSYPDVCFGHLLKRA